MANVASAAVASSMFRRTFQNFQRFWSALLNDYAAVAREVYNDANAHPVKTCLHVSWLSFAALSFKMKPNEQSFTEKLVSSCNDVASVGVAVRNQSSYEHVMQVNRWRSRRVLRVLDLGFATVVWRAESSVESSAYKYHCPYLRRSLLETLRTRIVDVGFAGRWIFLTYKMVDFDVNDGEWR